MFANFFIYGEGNFGEEIGRNFRKGSGQVSDVSCQEILGSEWRCGVSPRGYLALLDFFLFFFDFNAKRLQKFQVLVADLELGVGAEGGNQGSFVAAGHALFADADGGFEDEKNIVATFFYAGHDFGNLLRVGQRLIDGFAQFLHELLQLRIHETPSGRNVAGGRDHGPLEFPQPALYAAALLKSTRG